jgi:hypothetical protein
MFYRLIVGIFYLKLCAFIATYYFQYQKISIMSDSLPAIWRIELKNTILTIMGLQEKLATRSLLIS